MKIYGKVREMANVDVTTKISIVAKKIHPNQGDTIIPMWEGTVEKAMKDATVPCGVYDVVSEEKVSENEVVLTFEYPEFSARDKYIIYRLAKDHNAGKRRTEREFVRYRYTSIISAKLEA